VVGQGSERVLGAPLLAGGGDISGLTGRTMVRQQALSLHGLFALIRVQIGHGDASGPVDGGLTIRPG